MDGFYEGVFNIRYKDESDQLIKNNQNRIFIVIMSSIYYGIFGVMVVSNKESGWYIRKYFKCSYNRSTLSDANIRFAGVENDEFMCGKHHK